MDKQKQKVVQLTRSVRNQSVPKEPKQVSIVDMFKRMMFTQPQVEKIQTRKRSIQQPKSILKKSSNSSDKKKGSSKSVKFQNLVPLSPIPRIKNSVTNAKSPLISVAYPPTRRMIKISEKNKKNKK